MKIATNDVNKITQKQYSLEETVVGSWIDGKPIYQKTYVLTNLSGNNGNYMFPIDENAKEYIETLVHSEFRMTRNLEKFPQLASSYDFDTTSYFAEVWFNNDWGIYIYGSFGYPVSECHVTVQYTKVTDEK